MPTIFKKVAAGIVLAGGLLFGFTPIANAHPMDELLQQVYVLPAQGRVGIEIQLIPGVLIAPQFSRTLDRDGNGELSSSEIDTFSAELEKDLAIQINGSSVRPSSASVAKIDFPLLTAGGGSILIKYQIPAGIGDQITLKNFFQPGVKTQVQQAVGVSTTGVGGVEITHSTDGKTLNFVIASVAESEDSKNIFDLSGKLMINALSKPLNSPIALLALLFISALLGAAHAFTPGHGKTLMAAYLIGDKARTSQAIILGLVVTVTHTSSVIVFGLLTLTASHFILTSILIPILELVSGVFIVFLGVRLLRRRATEMRTSRELQIVNDQAHAHAHLHGLPHEHDLEINKTLVEKKNSSMRELLTMGITGGIIPCPEALTVLLLAVALNRTGLGLAMITAFSLGLALVLVGIGLLLVNPILGSWLRARSRSGGIMTVLPMISSIIVTVLGGWLIVRGINNYL